MQIQHSPDKSINTILESSPCPYFEDGRTATSEFVLPDSEWAQNFHTYLSQGYRRFGNILYRNVCKSCTACMPLRLLPDRFRASKSQKRTLRRNRDIRVKIQSPPDITPEKLDLFVKYQRSKHAVKEQEPPDYATHITCSHYGYIRTIEMKYYLGNRLIGVGIVDEGYDSLSSNYFYYDTDFLERRPGIFSLLEEISLARHMGKRFFYLGFYIEENPKMSYKKFFRPNQFLEQGTWKDFLDYSATDET
jgi:arginine-tRNA-protein transferase